MSLRIGIFSNTVELGVMVVRNLFIKLLRENYPDSHLILICEQELLNQAREFHQYASWVDECVAIETQHPRTTAQKLSVLRQIKSLHLDMFIFSPMSKLPCWMPFLCGIPVRVGCESDEHKRKYLTHPVLLDGTADDRDLHWSEALSAYVQALRLHSFKGIASHVPFVRLTREESFTASVPSDLKIVVHVGGSGNRRWPLSNFVLLCRQLVRKANAAIFLIGRNEATENRMIIEALEKENTNRQVFNLWENRIDSTARCIADADLFIGHDSGPMNLAVAVGTPVVVIRGVDPDNFSPQVIDPRHTVLSAWRNCGRFVSGSHFCDRGCPDSYDPMFPEYPKCMTSITFEDVWSAVQRQLEIIGVRSYSS